MITLERVFDPAQRVQVEHLKGEQFNAEAVAHQFRVRQVINGAEVPFTGNVWAYFLNANGSPVAMTEQDACSLENGAAVVTLTQECYAVTGRFLLTIYVGSASSNRTCVYAAVGDVAYATGSTVILPSGTTIPDWGTVAGLISDAESVVSGAQTDLDNLKATIDELHDNLASTATVVNNLYINPNSDKFSSTTGNLSVLVIPVQPDSEYFVWKNTATTMRLAVGNIAAPANNDPVTTRVMHAQPSADPLTIITSATDTYLYIQLYISTDSSDYTNNAVNMASLMVCKVDNAAEELTAAVADLQERMDEAEPEIASLSARMGVVVTEYDASVAYTSGDYVVKDGVLYRRKERAAAPSAEAWTSGHWVAVTSLSDEVTEKIPLSYFAPYYDATITYSIGQYVLYNNRINRCIINITTPETYTNGHWQIVGNTFLDLLDDLAAPAGLADGMADSYRFDTPGIRTTISKLNNTASSATTGIRTNLFAIHSPTRILVDDPALLVRINRYSSDLTFVNTYQETIRAYSAKCDTIISADEYPVYLAVGVTKDPEVEMTAEDLATITAQLHISPAEEIPYADVSMFQTIAVGGDSWTAGAVHSIDGSSAVARIGQGWGENMARQHGITCSNFAIGGTSLRTWFNSNEDGKGFKGMLAADAVGLYILSLGGSNDWQSGADGARGWEIGEDVPDSSTYYIGEITDISGDDYTAYPKTFYGYYGRVIEMLKEHAPDSRIIITTPNTYPTTNAKCTALYAATAEIAEHYEIPYLDLRRCDYFGYWKDTNLMNDQHPTAAMYAGMGRSIGKLMPQIIKENAAYFREYNGQLSTVAVAWAPVTK